VLKSLNIWNGATHLGIDFVEPLIFTGMKSKSDYEAYFVTPINKKTIFKLWGKDDEAGIRLVFSF
jgi:hypothetical protein